MSAQMDTLHPFTLTIGGKSASTARSIDVIDPATGEVFAKAPDCEPELLDAAVRAARAAQPAWAALPWSTRQAYLTRIAAVYVTHQDELARLLTREQGKPLARAKAEVANAAYWFSELARMNLPDVVIQDNPQAYVLTRRVPMGVVGAMVPWNYPVVLAAWKIAPALLTGNTLVLKPSPFTPLVTLRLGELLRDVLPPGVLNVVSGGDELGPWMSAHAGFDKLSFTGSTATGRRVMASAAGSLKRLTLELGGNDAAIVMPDVDIETVAEKLFWGAFVNSGQICIAAKRVYIHDSIYDRMAEALVRLAEKTQMGPGERDGIELGPVQNIRQFECLEGLLQDCKDNHLRFLAGGDVVSGPGYFIPVTLVDNPPDDARIVKEEPFGPILPLLRFSSVAEVVARANASEYGLAGSVWCRDETVALEIASQLQTGTVWINQIQAVTPHTPMAGHKQSGAGVENGEEGLAGYTLPQTLSVKRAN